MIWSRNETVHAHARMQYSSKASSCNCNPLWYWPRLIYHNIYNSSRDFNIPDSPAPRRHNRLWPMTVLFWILKLPSCGFRQHGLTSAVPSLPCRIQIFLSFPRCSLNQQLPKLPMLLSSLVLYSLSTPPSLRRFLHTPVSVLSTRDPT